MSWGDVLPTIKTMPVVLKLAWTISVVGTFWWFTWGAGELQKSDKPKEKAQSDVPVTAAATGSAVNQIIASGASNVQQNNGPIGVQNNAPVATQYNGPSVNVQSGSVAAVSIGGTLTVNHINQPQGSDIDNTVYTTAQLKKAFPLGYVVLRRTGESDWAYTPDTRDIFKWDNPPTIEVRPDFLNRRVVWDFKDVNVTFVSREGHIKNLNAVGVRFPMKVGRVYDWKLVIIAGYPVIHVVTLNDDQLKFTCAFGFREPTAEFDLQ